jgi:ribonuclease PH
VSRIDGRKANELRPVEVIRGFTSGTPGSVLIRCGRTSVLCTAGLQPGVPEWKRGSGTGWCTAEYDMLPGSTSPRRVRNRVRIDGRTHEIQRLIGRSLRAVVDMSILGENSIWVDCDVLQADGGTRTASVTGAYVALADALRAARRDGLLKASPLRDSVAAVSVGLLNGRAMLDLCYTEDSAADVDLNVVVTGSGQFVEVQGTGEHRGFSKAEFDRMLRLATGGIRQLLAIQDRALRRRPQS